MLKPFGMACETVEVYVPENSKIRRSERADTPRLSGVQIKAPVYLDADGTLAPRTGQPFTHLLKPAGTSGYEALPSIEWVAMELGRAAGITAPATALVAMPDGMPPALLKIAEPGDQRFRSVRMAPLYDAVATRVFPRLERDRLARKLNGKDDRLGRTDFRALASAAGLKAAAADAAIDEMLGRLTGALGRITLPETLGYSAKSEKMAKEMLDISRSRIESFG